MGQSKKKLLGNVNLPSSEVELHQLINLEKGNYKYSVEDYFQRPLQTSFKISPSGEYLSYMQRGKDGKREIIVKNIKTSETKSIVKEKIDLIREYIWVNSTRILYTQDKGGDENYHIFGIDVDGENRKELTPFDGVRVSIIEELKNQKDYIIVEMNKDNSQIFEPYKVNVTTGEIKKLFENKDSENPISNYFFDKDGDLRAYQKQKRGLDYTFYYKQQDGNFEEVITTNWKEDFGLIDFTYSNSNKDEAYVYSNLSSNTNQIVLYDLSKKRVLKTLFSSEIYDISSLDLSKKRDYEIDYYYYYSEKLVIVPVSKTYKKIHQAITNRFENKEYEVVSVTDEEDKFLIYVSSDRLYGIYYLYDINANQFVELFNLMPHLKEEEMAEMRPITFESRDGLIVRGYITIPKIASRENKVPLIVNPHGGPYGPRDVWGFNPEAQLFSSRGYATLQINYRGSGGYGKSFFLAGSKQIGRKMLDDLEDGVKYALSLGFINKKKIAIYGASYGGLATLGSLVKTPDFYVCGVDYVGVSNLFTFVNSIPPYWKPYIKQISEQWYDKDNEKEREIMEQVSPALNADKIKKPLFIVQGANDPRVNINESDQMVENLRKRGVYVPYMVRYDEGHGFHNEENVIQLYKCMIGFFSKYLKN